MLKIELTGSTRGIDLGEWIASVDALLGAIESVDEASGELSWMLDDLYIGSAGLLATPTGTADPDAARSATLQLIRGGLELERGSVPDTWADGTLRDVKRATERLPEDRQLVCAWDDNVVPFTRAAADTISRALAQPTVKSQGSAIGVLTGINVFKRHRASLRLPTGGRAVTCNLPKGLLDEAKAALGERVLVAGTLTRGGQGGIRSIQAESLTVLRDDATRLSSMRGFDPDFTGPMSTEEFTRWSRRRGA